MAAKALGWGAVVVLLAAPPLLPKYPLEILISILFFAYLGLAWNILGGYAGQFSFGHAAFFGIGAYTSTLLLLRAGVSPWLGMLAGGVLAAGFGLFEGYLSFRYGLRGPYFSLVGHLDERSNSKPMAGGDDARWRGVGSGLRFDPNPQSSNAPNSGMFLGRTSEAGAGGKPSVCISWWGRPVPRVHRRVPSSG